MDFGGLLLLALLWFALSLLGRSRQPGGRRPPARSPLPPVAPPRRGDATQREGGRLETLLREFERALEQAGGARTLGRPSPASLPTAEEVEERESLEVAPDVESLEQDITRPERPHLSQDEGAERVVAGRIAAAEARSGPLTRVDHLAFDQRIRREAVDATAVRPPGVAGLRRAVVWREILGPPVGLRDPER